MNKTLLSPAATPPALAPAGAGLPKAEELLLRYAAFPLMSALIPWHYARQRFQAEGRRILAACADQNPDTLTMPVLVPRQMAMEDSSRYWSVTMTVRHLLIVGALLEDMIVSLSQQRSYPVFIDIAAVKPETDVPVDILLEFHDFLQRFDQTMTDRIADRRSRTAHRHPWLGPLTAHQYLCLAAIHQRLHRRQIQSILRRAPS